MRERRNVPELKPPEKRPIEYVKKKNDDNFEYDINNDKIISKSTFKKINHYIYEFNFPNDCQLQQIKYNSFSALNIYSISFPPSLSIIFPEGLKGCFNLYSINFTKNDHNQSSLKYICDKSFKDTIITSIIIPESVKEIGSMCFPKCLSKIEFENGAPNLSRVGKGAFSYTQIESFDIPSNLKPFINQTNIFYKCNNLNTINFDHFQSQNDNLNDEFYREQEERIENKYYSFDRIYKCYKYNGYYNISQDFAKSVLLSQTKIKKLEVLSSNLNYFYFFNTPDLISIEIIKSEGSNYIKNKGCLYTLDKEKLIVAERNIKEAEIFSSCKYISNYAFNIKDLQKVSFENNSELLEISFMSFFDSDIQNMVIPDSVNFMEYGAFYRCKKLESINIPQSLKWIDFFTFSYTNLTSILIPKNIMKIGFGSFLGCFNLSTVSFEENSELIIIDDYAFSCTNIESISIPAKVYKIGNYCFFNCNNLKNIEFQNSSNIKKLGINCFSNTQIDENIIQISHQISFHNRSKINEKFERISYKIWNPICVENITEVFIPSRVEEIGLHAFYNCINLTKVEIIGSDGSDLSKIADGAFYNCTSLSEFKIPKAIKYFGFNSFANCINFKADILNDFNEVFIGKNAFENSGITSLNIDCRKLKINDSSFKNCKNLIKITIDYNDSCKIGKYAFADTSSLEDVIFEEHYYSKIKIGSSCFLNSSIKTIALPKHIINIPESCFQSCKNLKQIEMNDNFYIQKFGSKAFYESGIEIIFIPYKTKIIANECFSKCQNLKEIAFSYDLRNCHIKENAFSMTQIEKLKLVEGIKQINSGCFENCTALTDITFLDGFNLKKIKKNVFRSTGIEEIELPSSIQKVDESSFQNCSKLKTIIFKGKNVTISSSSFFECNKIQSIKFKSSIRICRNINDNYFLRIKPNQINQQIINTFISNNQQMYQLQPFNYFLLIDNKENFDTNYTFYVKKLNSKIKPILTLKNSEGVFYSQNMENIYFCDFLIESVTIPKIVKSIGLKAFTHSNLKKVDFEVNSQLEVIEKNSFQNLLLEEITIPDTVTEINDFAFSNCINLKNVNISKTSQLKRIGIGAFEKCSVESFLFPSTLSIVDNSAFYKCNKLTKIDNHSKCISFGYQSFYKTSIEMIDFPSKSTFLNSCFRCCTNLKKLSFLENPTKIVFGVDSFSSSGIESIDLDCNVDIQENAFAFCQNLKTIKLKGNQNKCSFNSFYHSNICQLNIDLNLKTKSQEFDQKKYFLNVKNQILTSKIEKLSLNLTLKNTRNQKEYHHQFYMENNCLVVDEELIYANLIDNVNIFNDQTISNDNNDIKTNELLQVPSTAKKFNFPIMPHIKKIKFHPEGNVNDLGPPGLFAYSNLTEIIIPNLVTKIPPRLFEHCHFLRSIDFEKESLLEEIGEFSFSNTRIEKINIPPSVQIIKQSAFSFNKYLKSLTFNGEIIENDAFKHTGIKEFNLSNQTRKIGSNAFQFCNELTKFNIDINESQLTEIGQYAFSDTSLIEINIPSEVKTIKSFTFNGCKSLKVVNFSTKSKLEEIDKYSFAGNLSLERINIPKSITNLSPTAFINTPSLLSIMEESNDIFIVNDNNEVYYKLDDYYHSLIFVPRNLKQYTVIQNCSSINSGAFCGPNIEEVTLPEVTLDSIEQCAFAHSTELKEIFIPNSVKSIGEEAFIDCQNLEIVEFEQRCQLKVISKFCFAFSGLKEINLPNSIQIIDNCSFYLCYNLSNINLLNTNVKYIGYSAFAGTSIEELYFPCTIKYIENNAFEKTKSLKSVDFTQCYKVKDWDKTNDMKYANEYIKKNKRIKTPSKSKKIKVRPPSELNKSQIITSSELNLNEENNANVSISLSTEVLVPRISKQISPVIIKPNQPKTPQNKASIRLNRSDIKPSHKISPPIQIDTSSSQQINPPKKIEVRPPTTANCSTSPRKRHSMNFLSEDLNKEPMKKITCYVSESSFNDSSVKIFNFNIKKYKWFNFFNACTKILEYNVNSDIHIYLKKMNKENLDYFSLTEKSEELQLIGYSYKIIDVNWENEDLITCKQEKSKINPKYLCIFNFLHSFKLSKVILTDDINIKEIPRNSFSYSCLKEITIPSTVLKIETAAFKFCTKLENVTFLPNSKLKTIGFVAFSNCVELKKFSLPESVRKISPNCFFNCKKLSEIELNEGLTEISFCLFANNYSLQKINIPDSVQNISKNAFLNCVNLKQINLSEKTSLNYIYDIPFENYQIEELRQNPTKYVYFKQLKKPFEKDEQFDLIQNDDGTFYEFGELTYSFIIPKYKFKSNNKLIKIVIPDSCSIIKQGAFKNCINLKIVEFKKKQGDDFNNFSIQAIEEEAFYNCKSLTHFVVPPTIETIGDKAFMNCSSLEYFEFGFKLNDPQNIEIFDENLISITKIGHCAFKNCSSLKLFRIPESCISIGKSIFMNCTSLEEIYSKGKSLSNIPYRAFYNCKSLSSLNIKFDFLFENFFVGYESFMNCISLKEFAVYSYSYKKLEKNKTEEEEEEEEYVESNDKQFLKSVRKHEISTRSFYNCKSLEIVKILIGNIEKINVDAFSNCTSLKTIEINSTILNSKNLNLNSFSNINDELSIKLICKMKEAQLLNVKTLNKTKTTKKRYFNEHSLNLCKSFICGYDQNEDKNCDKKKKRFISDEFLCLYTKRKDIFTNYPLYSYSSLNKNKISIKNRHKKGMFDVISDNQAGFYDVPASIPPLNI